MVPMYLLEPWSLDVRWYLGIRYACLLGSQQRQHSCGLPSQGQEGKLIVAGALQDPVDEALFVWRGASVEVIVHACIVHVLDCEIVVPYRLR
jgi:hypothetical protein